MGVRSLLSFMSNGSDFFKDCSYSNGYLVIDGINLVYVLYNKSPRKNSCYGGEYQLFHSYVCQFFSVLRRCGIKPVVVLDGAADKSKAMTQWRRARDQAAKAVSVDPANQHDVVVKPVFAVMVFIEAVKTFDNAVIFHSFYEADGYLAEIGRRLSCPVLSNDSDFFIFDVRYIPINSVDWANSTDSLLCQEFDREAFMKRFSMTGKPDMLPLLAVLMGNDYVNPHTFDRIFEQIHLPKKKYLSPRHRKMTGLLRWLSREDSVQDALDVLMKVIPLEHRERTRGKVVTGVAMYALDCKASDTVGLSQVLADIRKVDQSSLPMDVCQEFVDLYHNCDALLLTQILINRSVILSTLVENQAQESSRQFALPLTREYCRLIFTKQKELTETQSVELKVILRKGKGIVPLTLTLDTPLILETDQDKKDFLHKALHATHLLESDRQIPGSHQLLLACMAYWSHCSQQPESPTAMQVLAILVCLLSHEKQLEDNTWVEMTKKFRISDKSPKAVKNFDRDLVHSFSNLQAVLFQAFFVNNLLSQPLPQFSMLFWSGITMYNLCQGFSSPQDALKYFQFDKKFHTELSSRLSLWCSLLDININAATVPVQTKRRNRKKKSAAVDKNERVLNEDEKAPDCKDLDVNNRFAMLSL